MAKTFSNMLPLGSNAANFSLVDVCSQKVICLEHEKGTIATVIMFICNHCPYVKHINKSLALLAKDYRGPEIKFIAINSNDISNYPEDSPEHMQLVAKIEGYSFPYLFDETQEVAKAYEAACTPDFFIFNKDLQLVYRGQFDDSRPGNNIPVTGDSIRQTLQALLQGEDINIEQKPSLGCNIKWKN